MESVHTAQGQGIVWRHYGEVHGVGPGKIHNGADILGPDLRDAHRVGSNAAVSRQGVDRLYGRVFLHFFDDRMLTASAANDQKIHRKHSFKFAGGK